MSSALNEETKGLETSVLIEPTASYLPAQSKESHKQYAFGYTIRIHNRGNQPVQLMSRYWQITDANSGVTEIRGDGVIGEQPIIHPGQSHTYSSGAVLQTDGGTMNGSYRMRTLDNTFFDVSIPLFILARVMH